MPWTESSVELRRRFIAEVQSGHWVKSEICRRFNISRPTGDKWLKRFDERGLGGLRDRQPVAKMSPHALMPEAEMLILLARVTQPTWGPKKLSLLLEECWPEGRAPATSTIGEVLRRHGCVESRGRQRGGRRSPMPAELRTARKPNDVWCADFKGDFLLGNRQRCYPFTLTDQHSRFLLKCDAHPATRRHDVQEGLTDAFREYGLPHTLRTDNGVPFVAEEAIWGLSELSVWLIRLGIRLERTRPATPSDNGRHERMHKTLKAEACKPPAQNLEAQQRVFSTYRAHFNNERPHEALSFELPANVYTPSPRELPRKLPPLEYPSGALIRRIGDAGWLSLDGTCVYLGRALSHQDVALTTHDGQHWTIHFGTLALAVYDEESRKLSELPYSRALDPVAEAA